LAKVRRTTESSPRSYRKSLTTKDTEGTKEGESFTTKDTEDTKGYFSRGTLSRQYLEDQEEMYSTPEVTVIFRALRALRGKAVGTSLVSFVFFVVKLYVM
jgi:hypothetical protein